METQKKNIYKATVIGSGPSGIAILGQLISTKTFPILWIDPNFEGGRMALYKQVPANTRTIYFIDYMKGIPAYNDFIEDKNNKDNPMEVFKGLDVNVQPSLEKCYNMCNTLIRNIKKNYDSDQVFFHRDLVNNLQYQEQNKLWEISTSTNSNFLTEKVFLAFGSKLKIYDSKDKPQIPFEILVNDNPDNLQKYVNENDTIGVIGSSHSAILTLKHLEKLPNPPKVIHCFYREKIRYAEYTDEGIILDNLGLKGQAATWAKEHLEAGKSKIIKMHFMENAEEEKKILEKFYPDCTKIAALIGWERNSIPIEIKNGQNLKKINQIDHDGANLRIVFNDNDNRDNNLNNNNNRNNHSKKYLENIWGIGIAFPVYKKDLCGLWAWDVGVFKFGNAAKVIKEQLLSLQSSASGSAKF